jgi:hypothetical protein
MLFHLLELTERSPLRDFSTAEIIESIDWFLGYMSGKAQPFIRMVKRRLCLIRDRNVNE